MRAAPFALAFLALAGCVASPTEPSLDANATAPTAPAANLTTEIQAPIGERMTRVVETFVWDADHGLTLTEDLTGSPTLVPETAATGRGFLTSQVDGIQMAPWATRPFPSAFEMDGELEVLLTFSSDQPGGSPFKTFGLPVVGGWIGSTDRFAVFFGAADAPDAIEANKVYTLRVPVKLPESKLFFREGETLVVHPYLGYEVGPGTLSWHANDAALSGIKMGHQHFNVSAPIATSVLDTTGELSPFAGPSSEQNPDSTDVPLQVPPDAVYLVVEVIGTPATPGHLDVDLALLSGSDRIGSSTGPTAHEIVVLGPTALARSRDYVAHVTSAGAKGTFTLQATAYGPAPLT